MENKELIQIRNKIDKIDETLTSLLNKGAEIAKAIGEIKFRKNLPILNKERENEVLSKTLKLENGNFVNPIFIKIIEESKKIEEEAKNGN